MATRRTGEERSGGKMVRRRRTAAARTPYDRPVPAPTPARAPNWLTGVVFPKIASGATKLFSSMVSPESSSSSDSDSSFADGCDDENNYSHLPHDRVDEPNKKSGIKLLIERLIMEETFSREECDSLIRIIHSRVIDGSTREETQVTGSDVPDLCTKAIMEAKQWIDEKKEAAKGKGELGSPVDVAKSYMRARPPWSSPSVYSAEQKTPSPMERELLKDEAPYSFSSSKHKMYSLSSGSWNIQDEIRRVRCKATEDMLKTLPSQKIDLSSFALEPKGVQKSLINDKLVLGLGDTVQDGNLFASIKSTDASLELAATGVGTSNCLPASALDATQDGVHTEDMPSQPVILAQDQLKGVQAIQMVEGEQNAAPESGHSAIPELGLGHDSRSSDKNGPTTDGEIELRGKSNNNGFPFPGSSLSAANVEDNLRSSDDKNTNAVSLSPDKLANSVCREEICELLSETSVEVPVINEIDDATIDSQNDTIKHSKELFEELTRPNEKQGLRGKTTPKVENQQGRKPTRYNRKSKGKG